MWFQDGSLSERERVRIEKWLHNIAHGMLNE